MIRSLHAVKAWLLLLSEEVAELRTSSNRLSELVVNGIGHWYCLRLDDLCQSNEVADGDGLQILILSITTLQKPRNDSPSTLFVSDVGLKKT